MAEENQSNGANTANPTNPTEPQFAPQVVYLKDVSYEAPMGPRLPENATNPNVNMNLNTQVAQLGPELFEVTLKINVESTAADKTLWLCEVQQAGAFAARNIAEGELRRILGVYCPNYLLPFARQAISDMLVKGGFPPFLVPPVNFDALYDQAQAEQAQGNATPPQPTVN